MDAFTHVARTAYFSMEIALRKEIPTYAGGLGILAGDSLRSAADLEIPMVGVTLVSHHGYLRQELDAKGVQVEHAEPWDPQRWARPLDARVAVSIDGRQVWIAGWLYVLEGKRSAQPVLLLDTDLAENAQEDREITDQLYGGDSHHRLRQEMVLGIGGARMLHALGIRTPQYHMNEGHAALLTLELLRRYAYAAVRQGDARYDVQRVRMECNFTTHTPVDAGHDQFDYALVERALGDLVDLSIIKRFGGEERLNMTRLALGLSDYVNGVAKRHAQVSRQMFPGYTVAAITNGVHPNTWTSAAFARLYDSKVPGWDFEPELLVRADCCMSDDDVWNAHALAKAQLLRVVEQRCGMTLAPACATLGFARRMTAYKRPELLFSDLARLSSICQRWPLQVILAGKAHPRDESGKQLIAQLHAFARELEGRVRVAYLPDYGMELASLLVAGADIWLNTPQPPLEASGTSGMKAAYNGVPSLSVLDGWWLEGCIEGVTGWAVDTPALSAESDAAAALYDKLERVVLPLFYGERAAWIAVMKGAIAKNASVFSSHRMMRRYASEAYLR